MDQFSDPAQKELVKQQLAPHIRCQHLSMHWLTTVVVSPEAGSCVLAPLRNVLPDLLMLASGSSGSLSQHFKLMAKFHDIPASWTKPPRVKVNRVQSVAVSVQLDLNDLKQAVTDCAADKQTRYVRDCCCGECTTPPIGSFAFYPYLTCCWVEKAGSCVINLHTDFRGCLRTYCSYACDILVSAGPVGEVTYEQQARTQLPVRTGSGHSWGNFFSLPPMNGWDDAAWAITNLPAAGHLTIGLRVYDVGLAAPAPRQPGPPQPRARRGTPGAN
jgi:hypothetical protein